MNDRQTNAVLSTRPSPAVDIRRVRLGLCLAGTVALLGGCAAGLDGGTPSNTVVTGSNPPSSAPSYVLTAAERSWPCGALQGAMVDDVGRVRALQTTVANEKAAVSPTVAIGLARAFGQPEAETPAARDLATARARTSAYNSALESKGCGKLDVDRLLRDPAALASAAASQSTTAASVAQPSSIEAALPVPVGPTYGTFNAGRF
jgi:hypothetical protein